MDTISATLQVPYTFRKPVIVRKFSRNCMASIDTIRNYSIYDGKPISNIQLSSVVP